MGELIFVTGPARSGKSRFAERLAAGFGERVLFLATMEPIDEETRQRIQRHRQNRPETWTTREVPLELPDALEAATVYDARLIDCLTLWVSNQLLAAEENRWQMEETRSDLKNHITRLLDFQVTRYEPLIIVSNEVGAGVVPESKLGRSFRDLLGEANQQIARKSSRLYGLWSGHFLELKSLGARSIEDI